MRASTPTADWLYPAHHYFAAMSWTRHRGKRPRGDGSRGPRTASCTGWSHNKTASLFGSPTVCDFNIVIIPLIASVVAQQSHAAWIILPWILILRQLAWYRSAAVVTHLLPSISFIIHLLLRALHHTVVVLFMSMDLFMPRCLAAPVPMPTPLPQRDQLVAKFKQSNTPVWVAVQNRGEDVRSCL